MKAILFGSSIVLFSIVYASLNAGKHGVGVVPGAAKDSHLHAPLEEFVQCHLGPFWLPLVSFVPEYIKDRGSALLHQPSLKLANQGISTVPSDKEERGDTS